jgi:predicted Zn-dependent protease
MRKTRITALVIVALLCWISPHAWADDKKNDVDEIGDRSVAHRSIISQEKEIAIGKQYAELIDKQAKILKDPVINEM